MRIIHNAYQTKAKYPCLNYWPLSLALAIRVAWGDMDAFQHVNNTIYFRYFESTHCLSGAVGVADFIATSGVGPILHSVNCRFRLPVTYPDTGHVGVRVIGFGAESHGHGSMSGQ
ncbi:MAG: acyl-CoA thioesterase [Caldilineaceae bacterium]